MVGNRDKRDKTARTLEKAAQTLEALFGDIALKKEVPRPGLVLTSMTREVGQRTRALSKRLPIETMASSHRWTVGTRLVSWKRSPPEGPEGSSSW
jgi:hypothetical protein